MDVPFRLKLQYMLEVSSPSSLWQVLNNGKDKHPCNSHELNLYAVIDPLLWDLMNSVYFTLQTYWVAIQLPGGILSVGYCISIFWNNIDLRRRILLSWHLVWRLMKGLQGERGGGQNIEFPFLMFRPHLSSTPAILIHTLPLRCNLILQCYHHKSCRAQQSVSNWYVGTPSGWSHLH